MGKLTLYGLDPSPAVRTCLLTLKALELPFEYIQVDLLNRGNFSEEYLAKNPQHTVPTLEDDGNLIWDSHAICAYLVSKYAKNDALYPKDLLARAAVDQRLHFDSGALFQGCLRNITVPLLFKNILDIPQQSIDNIVEGYDFLEVFLRDRNYMAGNILTIADFSILTTTTSLVAFLDIDAVKYPKLTAWIQRMQELPYYQEANGKGAKLLVDLAKSLNYKIV